MELIPSSLQAWLQSEESYAVQLHRKLVESLAGHFPWGRSMFHSLLHWRGCYAAISQYTDLFWVYLQALPEVYGDSSLGLFSRCVNGGLQLQHFMHPAFELAGSSFEVDRPSLLQTFAPATLIVENGELGMLGRIGAMITNSTIVQLTLNAARIVPSNLGDRPAGRRK
jgi:hypothetical protein